MSNNQRPAVPKPPSPPPAIGHVSADGMATVVIGSSQTKYLVHKALIVHHSEYFAKALSGPWIEVEERVITVAGVGEEEFNLFVHWLYTQQISTERHAMKSVVRRPDAPEDHMGMILVLVQAYALGDRILASTFRTKPSWPDRQVSILPTITYAFTDISNNRNILQFLTDKFCGSYEPEDGDHDEQDALSELPPTFTARVVRRLACLRDGELRDGRYIEHATDEEHKSCKKRHLRFSGGENIHGYFGEPNSAGLLG
ncbi:hypothetical protein E8E11_003628 [Didymella keratinophila]|nr:hypothetical protein E8E11_003628 [Didymella keratinophila]